MGTVDLLLQAAAAPDAGAAFQLPPLPMLLRGYCCSTATAVSLLPKLLLYSPECPLPQPRQGFPPATGALYGTTDR
jgi:hypothetical protein